MQEGQQYVLTVTNHSTLKNGNFHKARVTMAPNMILFIIASEEAIMQVEGRDIRKVNVVMVDDKQLELNINELDLHAIERAVGSYYM